MSNDLIISQIRQRLEILYQMVDELETGGGGGGGGTTNYNELSNKPSIAGVQLVGNKTLNDLGAATLSDITDAFTPSTISLSEGDTFPSDSRALLTEHKPIMVNDTQYQFLEESGIDYLYSATPTSGAYPTISYLRVMKNSYTIEFHVTEIDTVPTANSTNLITSGGVETALAGKANISDLDAKVSLRDILGYGTVIPASTQENPQDLNNYASMGVFTIETSAVAATINNVPVVFPGRLFVLAGAVAGANIQVYITGENLYIRRRTTTLEWKPWVSMV